MPNMLRRSASRLALACLAGLPVIAWVAPAQAASGSGLTISVTQRWNQSSSQGRWTAYSITVRNDSAATFDGEVALIPNAGRGMGPVPTDSYPSEYRSSIAVPAGSARTVVMYVLEGPAGHTAELRDSHGQVLDHVDASTTTPLASGPAVAVLSDVAQSDQRVGGSLRLSTTSGSQFAMTGLTAASFPTSVEALTGLNAIVIDQLDSGALSQAQVQALRDFVGLGGALIEVAGASWRRTLLPLPADLLPLRPDALSTASLAPVAELGGLSSQLSGQVVTGRLAAGARAALTSPEGMPLIAQSTYGAGSVVELAFDPDAQGGGLAAAAWAQAVDRGLSGIQGGSQQYGKFGFGGPGPGGLTGSGPGSSIAYPGYMYQIVNGLPAAASPPFGLLVPALIVYVLLISVGVYLVLRAVGRRGLLWVAVPVLAVVCTAGAYGFGFGSRGSAYQVTEVQVQRPTPDGLIETSTYAGVLAPRRGDISVSAPRGSLLSTAVLYFSGGGPSARDAVVSPGSQPGVLFPSVPVWDVRPLQALSYTRSSVTPAGGPAQAIEARLSLRQGRIVGEVVNHTSRTIRDLRLVSAAGSTTSLAASLQPGATVAVDAGLGGGSTTSVMGKGGPMVAGSVPFGVPMPANDPSQALVAMAVGDVATRPGELALVGFTDPLDLLRVGGERPSTSGRAALVTPVTLQSADSLTQVGVTARQVSSYVSAHGQEQVYELSLPAGHTTKVGLTMLPVCCGPVSTVGMEVYDWTTGAWRPLPALQVSPYQGMATSSSKPVVLTAGETAAGVIRVRASTATGIAAAMTGLTLADVP